MKANVVTYHFCNENTNFNGWEEIHIDEKTQKKHSWENHTEKTWMKKHKLRWLKIHGKITKNPTVREKMKVTNLTALCELRHSTLSSWDNNYLTLFSSVHN